MSRRVHQEPPVDTLSDEVRQAERERRMVEAISRHRDAESARAFYIFLFIFLIGAMAGCAMVFPW